MSCDKKHIYCIIMHLSEMDNSFSHR